MAKGKTILVVDDEPFILKSLTFILQKGDFEVIEARDGEEAVAMIEQHHPSLVFLDVMMPKMNGYDVIRKVRANQELEGVFIVLLTAKGQETDRSQGMSAGANDYLTKPFSPSRILQVAREIMDQD
ncbi:MAG TPA: response regulator [Planctomycetes bacterium]|nr:response regulator [Planctomycetota bacterium]